MGMLINAGSVSEKNLSILFGGSDAVLDSLEANATNSLLLRNYMAAEIRYSILISVYLCANKLISCRVNKAPVVPALPVYRDVEVIDVDGSAPRTTNKSKSINAWQKAPTTAREFAEQ